MKPALCGLQRASEGGGELEGITDNHGEHYRYGRTHRVELEACYLQCLIYSRKRKNYILFIIPSFKIFHRNTRDDAKCQRAAGRSK